jgi:hypothetical protein
MPNNPPADAPAAPQPSLEHAARELRDQWTRVESPPPPAAEPAPPAETPPAPAPAPEVPPGEPAESAPAPTAEEFIEALIREADGTRPAETLKIPAGAKLPLKVDGQVVYKPAREALDGAMMREAFTARMREVAEHRRELEQHAAQLIADRARLEAREQWIAEERDRLRAAQQSPEAYERYQTHLRLMQEEPEYAKTFADALSGRERAAEDTALAAEAQREQVRAGVAQAAQWILEMGREPAFATVDLDRVRETYARQLEQGQAGLDPSAVRAIFAAEAQYLTTSLTPLQQRIAELEAQVAEVRQTVPTAAHNRQTQHALARASTPPVTRGAPPAPAPADRKVAPFHIRDLPEVNAAWNKRRD